MLGTMEPSDFLETTCLEKVNHEINVKIFMAKQRFMEFVLVFK